MSIPAGKLKAWLSPGRRSGLFGGRGRAFSLVEMLVVAAIVSVLAGVGLLAYRSYQRGRLVSEAARRIVAALTATRENAIAEGKPFQTTVDLDRRAVWIDQAPPDFIPKIVTPAPLPERVRIARVRSGSTTATTGTIAIVFDPDGTVTPAEIVLFDETSFIDPAPATDPFDRGSSATIRVYRSTGRAHVL